MTDLSRNSNSPISSSELRQLKVMHCLTYIFNTSSTYNNGTFLEKKKKKQTLNVKK